MPNFIYHEDYTGPRYTYGLTIRPVARFNIPDGWIIGSQGKHEKYPRYGTIDYPFALTEEQTFHYDMKLVEQDNTLAK